MMSVSATRGVMRPAGELRFPLLFLIVGVLAACAASGDRAMQATSPVWTARPWPEADRLFRQDARWLGADDAHSVDLGEGRVLWLFGDTFISVMGSEERSQAARVRNSIGIQTGSDPSSAGMVFSWGQTVAGMPASFFPESGPTWCWPGDGIRIDGQLLIFLTMIEPSANVLGFAIAGWQAVLVANPEAPPERWRITGVNQKPGKFPIVLGSGGVLGHTGYLYAYGTDPGGSRAYLARWPRAKAAAGDLREPQWWCGAGIGWLDESLMNGEPTALFADAQAEFGVHWEPRINRFVQIQSIGFGVADLGFRIAPRPEGPWGSLTGFYSPEEVAIPGILIYAAKSHPFLSGADLVVTYATNHLDPQWLMGHSTLYYPRFLRVDLQ
jgi:hypothetical protein